jgi:hypothetical protein
MTKQIHHADMHICTAPREKMINNMEEEESGQHYTGVSVNFPEAFYIHTM